MTNIPDLKLKILHLEDLPSDAELIHRALRKSKLNFDLQLVSTKPDYIAALENNTPDIILSDHSLPFFNSHEAMKILRDRGIKIPFILITATISEEVAVEVMKEGAWDYILKDRLQRLPSAIENVMAKHRADTERTRMLDQIIADDLLHKEAETVALFGTWRSDLITGRTVMSDGAYRILGYEPGEIDISENFFLHNIHPDDMHQVNKLITDAIRGSGVTAMDFRVKGKDGRLRHIHSQFQISWDEKGVPVSLVGFNQDISKQKEAEAKLIQSEVKYRHLFENNPLPMWVISLPDFHFLDVNEAAIRHYGYSREEFLSMTALDIRPADQQERFLTVDRTSRSMAANLGTWKHIKKNGSLIYVEIFAHSIDYDGKPARLILSNDITEVKHAQDKLSNSLAQLKAAHKTQTAILDALPANIALLDRDGTIIAVNNGWKTFAIDNELQGLNYCVGDNYITISRCAMNEDKAYGARISAGIEDVIAGRIPGFSMEYPCHSASHYRWFRAEVAPLEGDSGAGAVVMHINVTDRKLAELSANELNEQLYNSLSQLSDYKMALDQSSIVAITDQHGTITYANDNFCQISKYSREELIGTDHRLVNSGHHPKSYIKDLWDTITQGKIWKGELKNRAKDGTRYWVDTTILPFIDEHGKPYQYMSIRTDITERKKAEEQISHLTHTLENKVAERTAQLEQSMKELESFSYSVSHDLRAPLRVINGFAKLFLEDYADRLDKDARDYITTINDNATQMGQLIEDLLNLSRIGLEAFEKTEVDMRKTIEVTIHECRTSLRSVSAEITVDDLPPAECSRNLLRQVWVNLITNAIKYSSKKANPKIHIGSYITDSDNVYFIKDNGAGFDMKYADRLFGVFQRLHSRQDFEGTGVGLALVHRIITRHGGKVWAEGKPDEGATFYFSLPRGT